MDEIFIAIMEQIAQEMPELSLIDEDYGIGNGSRRRPVPGHFPLCINRKYKLRLARPRIRGTEKRIRTDRPAGHRLLRRYKLRIRHV